MTDRRVLVTGGAGFIGSRVCPMLLEAGYHLRVLDNLYRADSAVVDALKADPRVEFVEGDVRYREAVDPAPRARSREWSTWRRSASTRALPNPPRGVDVNLVGSQNVFDAAARAGVRRVVFASSASVYGEPDRLPMHEDDAPKPQTPYCISKLAGEHLLRFYKAHRGLDSNVMRFFNVYGPGQKTDAYYTSVIQVFLRRVIDGQAPVIDGEGAQSMDFRARRRCGAGHGDGPIAQRRAA